MMHNKTIFEVAKDEKFEPDMPPVGAMHYDEKPWDQKWLPKKYRHWRKSDRNKVAKITRCRVLGCGVPYAPDGVCGYCRERVRIFRRTGRATRKERAA